MMLFSNSKKIIGAIQRTMFSDDPMIQPVDFNINKFLQFLFVSTQQWCQKWDMNKSGIIDKLILLIQNFQSSANNKMIGSIQ